MRVAFTLIGGKSWTGGVNYLETLLSALSENPLCNVEPILFAGLDADKDVLERLTPYLARPPILHHIWSDTKLMRLQHLISAFGLQRDYLAEREFNKTKIELVFQHGVWYGCRFSIPTLAWIADFQHRRLSKMFNKYNYYWRDVGYWALSHCATQIMVSSQDAKKDCEKFYPNSIGKVYALPFSVKVNKGVSVDELKKIYDLPEKFYFMPNQFWKHKNHLNVVEALNCIKKSGGDVVIAVCGNPVDSRNSTHPQKVLDLVKTYQLENRFIYLGLIPSQYILPLMKLSIGVVNPSFFEGWSTTVEEAKAVGAPLILSDLPIHREQTEEKSIYFQPSQPKNIAKVLEDNWLKLIAGPRKDGEYIAAKNNKLKRYSFAMNFAALTARSLGKSAL